MTTKTDVELRYAGTVWRRRRNTLAHVTDSRCEAVCGAGKIDGPAEDFHDTEGLPWLFSGRPQIHLCLRCVGMLKKRGAWPDVDY